ncbi:alkaline phosphatase family protein [Actinoplanes utahensis]|uniref:Phosphodiesterase n=1 Tax=Actinoplanes utahensis TaxID=1869 RepID=A0A0A6UN57_ACTUT|nr:alkaline phosphatase family protein [Actinoplanes utahensis]KHD76826.1 hypothetical protein MB27_14900 [Actinoplanes utahensis]GIF33406.1 hypothetical protein Aut01nite_63920 [Actinoplanes utahensis]
MKPLVMLNLAGLNRRLLAHMPHLSGMAAYGWQADLGTVLPALACSAQTTYLSGTGPARHGVVGDGWYSRDRGRILFWRRRNLLTPVDRISDAAAGYHPGHPGPAATGPATAVIRAAQAILDGSRPSLLLARVDELDRDLQRYGPDTPAAVTAAATVDAAVAGLTDRAGSGDIDLVVLSEYGVGAVRHPVAVNRLLRAEGFLEVTTGTATGMEYLDTVASRAFAVADHQVAHVYVPDPADHAKVRALLEAADGVDEVLDRHDQGRHGLEHPNGGDLLAIARPDAWFSYYYWLDDTRAPHFARGVEPHRKPGYDPTELLADPASPELLGRAALIPERRGTGFRYTMNVVPLDPAVVRGSHGRLPDSADRGPVLLTSADRVPAVAAGGRVAATDVRQVLLALRDPA